MESPPVGRLGGMNLLANNVFLKMYQLKEFAIEAKIQPVNLRKRKRGNVKKKHSSQCCLLEFAPVAR